MLDDPRAVRAIIVGIDQYDYGEHWGLDGPAADALRMVEWLVGLGVARDDIALFLSADSWGKSKVGRWMNDNQWTRQRSATSTAISHFINDELPGLGGTAVFVYWGGHGSIDDNARLNYLFTQEAAGGTPYCLIAQDLLATLKDALYCHLQEQVCIFDICATLFSDLGDPAKPLAAPLRLKGKSALDTRQCTMYAASAGRIAVNSPEREAGRFSELLLAELVGRPTRTMQDFVDAYEIIIDEGHANGLLAQYPTLSIDAPGHSQLLRRGYGPLVGDLLRLLKTRQISIERMRRLYYQSLPDISRPVTDGNIERWLCDLDDVRSRSIEGYPSALIEFAERLGRDQSDAEFREWAKHHAVLGQYPMLTQKLDDEQRAEKSVATLFIEIASQVPTTFAWWLDAEDPSRRTGKAYVPVDADGVKAALEKSLPKIIPDARFLMGNRYLLRIGFIVPAELLSDGFETIRIRSEGEPDFVLNQEFPVLFHWYNRVASQGANQIAAWRDVLESLVPRIERGDNAQVLWLDGSASAGQGRYAHATAQLRAGESQAVCLGVEHPFNHTPDKTLPTIVECLRNGVPCLFWLHRPRVKAKAAQVREQISQAFARHRPQVAPVSLWREQKGALPPKRISQTLTLVWDVPSYLPANGPDGPLFEDEQ